MRLVVADTAPLNYLILIGHIELLSALFQRVLIPEPVRDELRHREAPELVRQWIAKPPSWLEVVPSNSTIEDADLARLDDGERAAIELAIRIRADLVLMDDREGVRAARDRGFAVIGTLGVLDLAARRQLVRFEQALTRLTSTSFRCRPEIIDALLAKHRTEQPG